MIPRLHKWTIHLDTTQLLTPGEKIHKDISGDPQKKTPLFFLLVCPTHSRQLLLTGGKIRLLFLPSNLNLSPLVSTEIAKLSALFFYHPSAKETT